MTSSLNAWGKNQKTLSDLVALHPGNTQLPGTVFIFACDQLESGVASFCTVLFVTFMLGWFLAAIYLMLKFRLFHLLLKYVNEKKYVSEQCSQ